MEYEKCKRPRTDKMFVKKKNKAGTLPVPDFKIFYKAITIKTVLLM